MGAIKHRLDMVADSHRPRAGVSRRTVYKGRAMMTDIP